MFHLPFEIKVCPQDCGAECGKKLDKCATYAKLPEALQERCKESLHLLQYLHALPMDEYGIPEYYDKINRSLKGKKNPNLIYRTSDELDVHVLANPGDIRDHYIPIEPNLADDNDALLEEVETRLADHVEEFVDVGDASQRIETIISVMDKLVNVQNGAGYKAVKQSDDGSKKNGGNGDKKGNGKIAINPLQYKSLRYLLRRKLDGMGILNPLILDTNIEDISCSGLGHIFVEHKIFGSLQSSIGFDANEELDKFVIQLAEGIKHPVTFREPCVDATLPDGSRINIVFGTDVSKRGSNFSIRKFADNPLSVMDLIQFGALNYDMAAYLSFIMQEGMNVWISGETASGKTTVLNAITTFIPPDAKIVSIEDTPEVQVPHHNWIRGVTRGSAKGTDASEVSMFDLLKAALRQRPNMIIVGEIRGAEGAIAFQAMQTGHACMSTFHAASVSKLIQRVTGNPINVPKTYVDNLNVIVICQQVRLASGGLARRITSINEIISYDSISDSFSFIESFAWDPLTDTFQFRGLNNSYLLEYKIAPRRGFPHDKRRKVYKLLKQRADTLKRIHDQGKTDFNEIYAILAKAYREGLFN